MDDICVVKEIYKMLYQFEKEFQNANSISINDAMVLCCLKNGEEKTAGDICEFVGLSNSRVSKVLCSVEDNGYISRRLGSTDRRQMFFRLTDSGRQKISEMESKPLHFAELINKILKRCAS